MRSKLIFSHALAAATFVLGIAKMASAQSVPIERTVLPLGMPSYPTSAVLAGQTQPPSTQGATPSNAPSSQGLEQEINSEVAEAGNGKVSLTEVNKELSNPISTIWALSFQQRSG